MKTIRDIFGRELLAGLSTAAALESVTGMPISTEGLVTRILHDYTQRLGERPFLANECYSEWLTINSRRLQRLARRIGERRAARLFEMYAV